MATQQIITFVFTDIEHSTQLAHHFCEDYPELLERHRRVIREAIQKYNGKEVNTAGDGFFITFENPKSALLAVKEIQAEFGTKKWATEIELKVRIGIHTGLALLTKSGYSGVEIHKASRICNAAHGGQVLISDETKKSLGDNQDNDFTFLRLGDYLLKDFDEPVGLYQLNIPGLKDQFPKPRVDSNDKKIAVLPFINLDKGLDNEYIGDGIAEEIIVALGKVKGLRVVSRSSAFALKNGDVDAMKAGQKLHVGSVLKGRIREYNGKMRISVELVDTESGFNLWSGQYDSEKSQLMNMEDQITRKITEVLDCDFQPGNPKSIQKRQTHNAEAYDFYLRGRRFYLQFSTRSIELALQMFEKAVEVDNTYALAYAGIADCYSYQYQHKIRSSEIIGMADKASKKAVELAPSLGEVYVSRGIVMALLMQLAESERLFQLAIELEPNNFYGWFHYGRTCFAAGELDKAARLFEQASRVEPDDYQSILLAAQVHNDIGHLVLSLKMRKRGVEIAERCLELNPGDTRALYLAANALVFLHQPKKSIAFLQRALLLEPNDSMLLYNAGCIYALLQMKKEALACLEASYKAGLTLRGWYENDSNLDSIRDEPLFIKLLERMKKDES